MMAEQNDPCAICGRADVKADAGRLNCTRCGLYTVSLRIGAVLNDPDFPRLRIYLSAHLRQASDRGEVVEVRHDTWKALAEGHEHTPVSGKLDMLLSLFCKRSGAGKAVALNPIDDFVLVDAADVNEMTWLTVTLAEHQVLQSANQQANSYVVTAKGWERNSPMDPGGVPGTCFVAMSFDKSLDAVYDTAIEPAGKACGLAVKRADRVEHNDIITDVIQAQIRRSQINRRGRDRAKPWCVL